jgi:hypothetical protein
LGPEAAAPLLDTTIAERTLLGFRVHPEPLQARLPAPWQVAATPSGANLVVIFNEVFLNQDAGGAPAPDATTRYVGIVVPGRRSDPAEEASVNLRIYAAHPRGTPGKYGTAVPAAVRREQRLAIGGASATVDEQWTLRVGADEELHVRLRYARDTPAHVPSRSRARSAVDPQILRVYHTDQLACVVRDAAQGVDRVLDVAFRSTIAEWRDCFDGAEHLVSVTTSPWYYRRVHAG